MLNRVEKELPFMSDLVKADDIELQEYRENATRSTNNLIEQFVGESSENFTIKLRSIRSSLEVEVAKTVQLQQHIEQETRKLKEI